MYKRKGKLLKDENVDELIIVSDDEQSYQISHIGAFIWNKLDGETNKDSISHQLAEVGNIEVEKSKDITEQALDRMLECDLVQQL